MKLAIYRTNGRITNIQRVPVELENDDFAEKIANFNSENAYRNLTADVVTIQDGSVIDYLAPIKMSKEKSAFLDSIRSRIDNLRERLTDIQDDVEALDRDLDDLGDLINEGFEGES